MNLDLEFKECQLEQLHSLDWQELFYQFNLLSLILNSIPVKFLKFLILKLVEQLILLQLVIQEAIQ